MNTVIRNLLLVILSSLPVSIQSAQCVLKDSSYGYKLDLSTLDGANITLTEQAATTWRYVVSTCVNGFNMTNISCPGNYMVAQIDENPKKGDPHAYGLAKFDTNVEPYYDKISQKWLFEYKNGCNEMCSDDANTNFNRRFNWIWYCDDKSYPYQAVSVTEVAQCTYNFIINSSYSCPNCVYTAGNHTLDLSSLNGEVINFTDSVNINYSFQYSPCTNMIICNNNKTMAIQIDKQKNQCVNSLGFWEGLSTNTKPIYNKDTKEWVFTYRNGNVCSDQNQAVQLNIYWQCDPNVSTYKVINASQVQLCEYEMILQSKFACT